MYSLSPLIVALYFLLLGTIVAAKAKHHPTTVPFVAMCMATFLWQITWAMLYQTEDVEYINAMITFGYLIIIFLPTTLYHFLVQMAGEHGEMRFVRGSYGIAFGFAAVLLGTDWFVDGHYEYYWGAYPKAGILHPLHVAQTLVVVVRGLLVARRKHYFAPEPLKTQLEYCNVSVLVYLLAGVDYLCNYGVEFYPPGIYFVSLSLSIFAYALINNDLFDAQAAMARITSIIVVCFAVVMSFLTLQHWVKVDQVYIVVANSLLGLFWAFFGHRVQKYLQKSAEKKWFQNDYSAEVLINKMLERLMPLLHRSDILKEVRDLVKNTMQIHDATLFEKTPAGYRALDLNERTVSAEDIVNLCADAQQHVFAASLISQDSPMRSFPGYYAHGYVVMLRSSDELEGMLLLGRRLGNKSYSTKDNRVLVTMCRQVLVFLDRAVAHGLAMDRIVAEHSERLTLTQAIAANIAHELRTPLTTIGLAASSMEKYMPTLWQGYEAAARNAEDQFRVIPPPRKETIKQGLTVIQNSAYRAQSVITLLLANVRDEIQSGEGFALHSMRTCIERALEDYPFQGNLRQKVIFVGQQDFYFFGSETLMIYVIYNLMKNALYALAKAGKGKVNIWLVAGLAKNELHFLDSGSGIAADILPQIFDNFFTTKPGDVGAGLGLTFCKRVICSFGGEIDCRSQDGGFTEFVIYLPPQDFEPTQTVSQRRLEYVDE
ncbi:MAG: ATP-binding protein [Gammaproteobacteria bacterium]|nr:ATP-binding protein [Gammaproteobacteria bacterium]